MSHLHPPPGQDSGRGLQRELPAPERTNADVRNQQNTPQKRIRQGTKFASLLQTLLDRGELGLNRFESERLVHDHVLPSSIASLTRTYGFQFYRKEEVVPGYRGSSVYCSRYWLTPEDRVLAQKLLEV